MTSKKSLLNDLLDIGGVATLNNLYEPTAKTYKGSMKRVRANRDFWLKEGLIEVLSPYPSYRSEYPVREVFYGLTKKGARFIGREEEWKFKKDAKASKLEDIEHESVKFDYCLSFTRLFPEYNVTILFNKTIGEKPGLIPDITVYLNLKTNPKIRHIFFVEIERKKTVSRTFSNKILRYVEVFNRPEIILPQPFTVLIVFLKSKNYCGFLRPQQMTEENIKSIESVRELTKDLATKEKYGATMPDYFRYTAQADYWRLNEKVCYKKDGTLVTPLE